LVSKLDKSTNPAEPVTAPPGVVSDMDADSHVPAGSSTPAVLEPEPASPPNGASNPGDEAIERLATAQVGDLLALETGSAEMGRMVDAIERLGDREFIATAAMSGRLLDRRFRILDSTLLGSRAPMARQLAALRKLAGQIDPARLKLGAGGSPDDEIRELDRYFDRFGDAQPRLQEVLDQLNEGRFRLEQDNATIANEESSLASEVETLRRYAFLAERIDHHLAERIEEMESVDPERARRLEIDLLTVIRRRRQEILTQQAITTQGLAALRIVQDNNAEVIRAVASAVTTTMAAMRTAVMTAQAVASQRIALGHLHAAQLAATSMADHAAALEAETAGPGGAVAALKLAWSDVQAALDRFDARKAQAVRTIAEADRELTLPKPGISDRRR
jgi:uncharacterized protein YaaN involved in tellurite resistance